MKKTQTAVKFRVEVNPSLTEKIGNLMSKCDLGINKVYAPEFYTCQWSTTAKVNKTYITKMRKRVKEAFELNGDKVLSVKTIK